MTIVRPITERDILPFRNVLDRVCRERKYLAQLEAPPLERVAAFVHENIQSGFPITWQRTAQKSLAGVMPFQAMHYQARDMSRDSAWGCCHLIGD